VRYLERKKQNDEKELEKNHIIFGLMAGFILIVVGFLLWLTVTSRLWAMMLLCVIGLGGVLLLLAIIAPALLKFPCKAFRAWGKLMGRVIFTAVLVMVYFLLIVPVGLGMRRKQENQGYAQWNETPPKLCSTFCAMPNINPTQAEKTSYFNIVQKLLALFVASKHYLMIPALIIMVLLGLVFFFTTSNVVLVFVYAIF